MTKKIKMDDGQKKLKMKDDRPKKWKMTKKIQNGRRPKKSKYKMSKKIQNVRCPKKFNTEDDQTNKNGR